MKGGGGPQYGRLAKDRKKTFPVWPFLFFGFSTMRMYYLSGKLNKEYLKSLVTQNKSKNTQSPQFLVEYYKPTSVITQIHYIPSKGHGVRLAGFKL